MILEYMATYSTLVRKYFYRLCQIVAVIGYIFGTYTMGIATENILIYSDIKQLNISDLIEVHPVAKTIDIKVVRPQKGDKKSIKIVNADGKLSYWMSFALTNQSKQAIQRLLIVPHSGGGNDGLLLPILSGKRIAQIYSSNGATPQLQRLNANDMILLELPAEKTITYVIKVADALPKNLSLWDVKTYQASRSYLPFYQGLIVGILAILAIFSTSLLFLKRNKLYGIASMLCWSSFVFALQEFGYITVILPNNDYLLALIRAVSELANASLPILLIFSFFNKNFELKLSKLIYLVPIMVAIIALLLAFISPSLAATIARLNAILAMAMGFILIIRHWPTSYFSMAQTLLPIWFIFALWSLAQVYFAVSADILYLNLLVEAIYIIFLMMTFSALLQDFTQHRESPLGEIKSEDKVVKILNSPDHSTGGEDNLQKNNLSNLAITGSGQVLWEWDLINGQIKCGTELDDMLHYAHDTMTLNMHGWVDYLHPQDNQKFENLLTIILERGNSRIDQDIRLRTASGEYLWFELRAIAVTDDDGYLVSFIGTLNNVSVRKASEDRLYLDAINDSLTGLPNRSLFIDRFERAIKQADGQHNILPALLMVDINRFRTVNESVGIAVGDGLLMTIANRIDGSIDKKDTVARLSGDQFGIILANYGDIHDILEFGKHIQKLIASPIDVNGREIVLSASVGVAFAETGNDTSDNVLYKAELAITAAKQNDNQSVMLYSPELDGKKGDKFILENDLRQALARNEFEMFYQPIISLKTMRPVGFEALIRWHHPTKGDVLPSKFIQLAEETGQIHELGQFTMMQAAKQLNLLQRTFNQGAPLFISVNMSSSQLFQPELVEQVHDILNRFNVIDRTLKIEVTESLIMKNPERAAKILHQLRDIGSGLAVDDFGTGYSSLAYLHKFPFEIVKIDRSFVSGENFGETRPIILKAIIQLANELGLKVVAEGVEKDEQAHELIDFGCELVQGYRFGEPMTAKDCLNFLSVNYS